jgi:Ulp1 family protease
MIGKTSVNVKSLNSLKPAEWLKDTILTAYLDLLGNEVYAHNKEDKNPPKLAVFDSHFLNNLGVLTDDYS